MLQDGTQTNKAVDPARPVEGETDHLDVAGRAARGKAARDALPRSAQADCGVAEQRDPVGLLRNQETRRVPELIGLRHQRMLVSPFSFYRGAAVVMAADLAASPDSELQVQACGDAHLSNFGGFAAPDRQLVFDVNDFDETSRAPFEWDVKRLAASFVIAGRARGLSSKKNRALVVACVRSYREAMAAFAAMSNLDVWYARLDVATLMARWSARVTSRAIKRLDSAVAKAESKDSLRALAKLTERVNDEFRIVSDPPVIVPVSDLGVDRDELSSWLGDRMREYRQTLQPDRRHLLEGYRVVDFARKVVGVGSVGTRCWIALLLGKDDTDPLFLQIKEAEESVLEAHAGKSGYATHGQRVVEGQRLLQAASDIFLGWIRTPGLDGVERDFYVRQLWDWKISADVETMLPESMPVYAEMCGWTLARGHARSGDRVAIAAYLGSSDTFDRAVADFAEAYADQNQRDFDTVAAALAANGGTRPAT